MKVQEFAEELVKRVAEGLATHAKNVRERFEALEARVDTVKALELRMELLETKMAAFDDRLAEFAFKGVYVPGARYRKGNFVSHQGSVWCAKDDTSEPPATAAQAWQLAVKRGRDGRDMTRDGLT